MSPFYLILTGAAICCIIIFLAAFLIIRNQRKRILQHELRSQQILSGFMTSILELGNTKDILVRLASAVSEIAGGCDWKMFFYDGDKNCFVPQFRQEAFSVISCQGEPPVIASEAGEGALLSKALIGKEIVLNASSIAEATAMAIPVISGSDDMAVIEMSSTHKGKCSEQKYRLMKLVLSAAMLRINEFRKEHDIRDAYYNVRKLMDVTPDFILVSDTAGRCTFANRSYLRFFGFDQMVFRNTDVLRPLNHEQFFEFVENTSRITRENPTVSYSKISVGASNVRQWTLWNETGVFDQQGQLTEIISVGRDISVLCASDQKKDEQITKLQSFLSRNVNNVRQPVTQLMGAARIIDSGIESEHDLIQVSEFIKQSVNQLDALSQELMAAGISTER